jgi:hypothetical protein
VKRTTLLLSAVLIAIAFAFGIAYSELMTVEDIDPAGLIGPGDPDTTGHTLDAEGNEGYALFMAKEPDNRWHLVGSGITPWGGTVFEFVGRAIKADGTSGLMGPQGEFTADDNPEGLFPAPADPAAVVFDSPEGSQIDWVKIDGPVVQTLAWFNGTGAWDGLWFTVDGDYLLVEILGMNDEAMGAAEQACDVFGDRACLAADPLPPAPPEAIWIGGDGGLETRKHPSTPAPFLLRNNPNAPATVVAVEPLYKAMTKWGAVREEK